MAILNESVWKNHHKMCCNDHRKGKEEEGDTNKSVNKCQYVAEDRGFEVETRRRDLCEKLTGLTNKAVVSKRGENILIGSKLLINIRIYTS